MKISERTKLTLMKLCPIVLLFCVFAPRVSLAQNAPQAPVPTLAVGFGISEITPSKPTPMAGYYGVRAATTADAEFNIDQFKAAAKFIRLCGSVEAAIASIRQYQKIAELFQ